MRIFKIFIPILFLSLFFIGCPKNDDNTPPAPTGTTYFPVLVEDFTNIDCIGCADVHMALDAVLENYLSDDEMPVVIEYHHLLYPNDPYHNASPSMHNSRGNYYDFTSIPQLVIDGNVLTLAEANSADEIKAKIDSARATDNTASISISESSDDDSVSVSLTVSANDTIIAFLYCYLVRVKTELDEAGDNGLTEYDWVAAAAFTDVAGQSIAIAADDDAIYDFKIAMPGDISGVTTDGYAIVAFVQKSDKTVLGAASVPLDH